MYKSTKSRKFQIYQITKFTKVRNPEKHESTKYAKIQNPEKYKIKKCRNYGIMKQHVFAWAALVESWAALVTTSPT
jgi:hypothetical protein